MSDTMRPEPKLCACCSRPLGVHRFYLNVTFTGPPAFSGPVLCSDACASRYGGATADEWARQSDRFSALVGAKR